jgi:hypothetical protein
MLKTISWMEWLTTVGVTMGLYYIMVLVRLYRAEWSAFFKGLAGGRAAAAGKDEPQEERPELYIATEKALQALVACVEEGTREGSTRDQIIANISSILAKYAYLKDTPYAIVIHHLLLRETNQSVRLNEEEVKGLWRCSL